MYSTSQVGAVTHLDHPARCGRRNTTPTDQPTGPICRTCATGATPDRYSNVATADLTPGDLVVHSPVAAKVTGTTVVKVTPYDDTRIVVVHLRRRRFAPAEQVLVWGTATWGVVR